MAAFDFFIGNKTHDYAFTIAIIGWLLAFINFISNKIHEKNLCINKTRREMLEVIQEWVKIIENFNTCIYDDLSKQNLGITPRKLKGVSKIETFSENISFIDTKINGIFKSQGLKTVRNHKRIDKLSILVYEVEDLIQFQVIPLDIRLKRERFMSKTIYSINSELELNHLLRQITDLLRDIQEIIWKEKMTLY